MGRAPCCSKVGLMRGPWSVKEDALLTNYIQQHGEGQWRSLPKKAGLLRCGKSCRLRWMNYLRPGIKRGNISEDEEDLIVRLHGLLGNRWSLIAGRLPGRTDNEIKNYWNTYLLKKLQNAGINPNPHKNLPKPTKKSKNSDENPKKKKKKQSNNTKKSTGGAGQGDEDVVMKNATNGDQGKVNGGNNDNKNTNSDDDGTSEVVAKVKVYLPKAMRVSPSSSSSLLMPRTDSLSSLASGAASSSSNSGVGSGDQIAPEVTWQAPVFELGDVTNYYVGGGGDGDDCFLGGASNGADGFLLPFLNQPMDSVMMSGGDVGTFDMVYDEYLQLLNLDN